MPGSRPPPAVDVIESEEFIQHLHPSFLTIDYSDTKITTTIIASTTLMFAAILFASLFLCSLFPTFRSLRTKHRVFMSLAIARGVYGFSCIILGGHALFNQTNLDRDVVFGTSATSSFSVYFTLGFFFFELAAVILSDIMFKSFSKMLIMHHSLALVGYGLAILYEANYCFGTKALLLEMSTPFSCLCFVLLKAGMENSKIWRLNQIFLVHTFHLRSVLECYMWYITYCHWPYILEYMPKPVFALLYANLTLVTFVMTPYWGYKKTQQLFNPVDWNFQESRGMTTDQDSVPNGSLKKTA